ncbi:nucleobase-ascorbate transporter 3 [Salvia divinorum]|uniref:Nucleobase-ascorbate transporter 3 n=1 Tax=Salvia divinorum TaxID=28513 RepID=A0ABD1I2H4_SALDI
MSRGASIVIAMNRVLGESSLIISSRGVRKRSLSEFGIQIRRFVVEYEEHHVEKARAIDDSLENQIERREPFWELLNKSKKATLCLHQNPILSQPKVAPEKTGDKCGTLNTVACSPFYRYEEEVNCQNCPLPAGKDTWHFLPHLYFVVPNWDNNLVNQRPGWCGIQLDQVALLSSVSNIPLDQLELLLFTFVPSLTLYARCSDRTICLTKFYKKVLGFGWVKRPGQKSPDFDGVWLFAHGMGLHLIKCVDPSKMARRSVTINPRYEHMSFQTLDVHDVIIDQVFIHDPDEYMVEICNCQIMLLIPVLD